MSNDRTPTARREWSEHPIREGKVAGMGSRSRQGVHRPDARTAAGPGRRRSSAREADPAALPYAGLDSVFALELREELVGLERRAQDLDLALDRREVAVGRGGETGLDDVDAQPLELARDVKRIYNSNQVTNESWSTFLSRHMHAEHVLIRFPTIWHKTFVGHLSLLDPCPHIYIYMYMTETVISASRSDQSWKVWYHSKGLDLTKKRYYFFF